MRDAFCLSLSRCIWDPGWMRSCWVQPCAGSWDLSLGCTQASSLVPICLVLSLPHLGAGMRGDPRRFSLLLTSNQCARYDGGRAG